MNKSYEELEKENAALKRQLEERQNVIIYEPIANGANRKVTIINVHVYTGMSLIYWDFRTIILSMFKLLINFRRKI